MEPGIIEGGAFSDSRGLLKYNNDFDASRIKRIYTIENKDKGIQRGWQGHRMEQRWFSAVKGAFRIKLIAIDDWEKPSPDLKQLIFEIFDNTLDVLHIPPGYVSCIQAIDNESKLLVMADFSLGEINDEYKFNLDYFFQK